MKPLSRLTGGCFYKKKNLILQAFYHEKTSQAAQCIVISLVLFLLSCSISWKSLSDGLKQLE